MASKRRNMFHENKTQEMTKTGSGARVKGADLDSDSRTKGSSREFKGSSDHNRAFRATRQGTAREDARNFPSKEADGKEKEAQKKLYQPRFKIVAGRIVPVDIVNKEGTPVPQPSSSRMDGSTSAAPHLKKCGPKLDSQPARQHRNGRVSPTNSKNVSARDKKVEETQCRNKDVKVRLKSIEERKAPSYMQEGTPVPQPSSSRMDGSTSAAPHPKKCGPKLDSQPARQHRNGRVSPKNSKNVSARDKKVEETQCRNKGLQERLKRVEERKPTSHMQTHDGATKAGGTDLKEEVSNVPEPEVLARSCGGGSTAHVEYSSVNAENRVEIISTALPPNDISANIAVRHKISPTVSPRKEKEHEGKATRANMSPEYQERTSSEQFHSQVDGPNLHAPIASQHREKKELPNSNRNNSSNYTLREIYAKVNDVEEKMKTLALLEKCCHSNAEGRTSAPPHTTTFGQTIYVPKASGHKTEEEFLCSDENLLEKHCHTKAKNQVEITPPDLPPNGVSTSVEVDTISPAVNSVCPPSRTDEKVSFSDIESLRKEKEHEGEATETNNSPEYKETTPKTQASSSRMDGSASATPQPKKSGSKLDSQPPSQRRNEELRAKNKKNVTFGNKKAEEIRIQNKELRERLRIIKERKTTAVTNETTPKTRASSSRMDGSASATPQPKKSGSKLDSQPPSQRRNEELRAKNKKNVTFGNKKAEEIRIQNKELRERLRIIKERKTTAVTDAEMIQLQKFISGEREKSEPEKKKEEEHEGEVAVALENPDNEGKILSEQTDGPNLPAPPSQHRRKKRKIRRKCTFVEAAAKAYDVEEELETLLAKWNSFMERKTSSEPSDVKIKPNKEEIPENGIFPYIIAAVDEFGARYNYWMEQVQERLPLLNTQGETSPEPSNSQIDGSSSASPLDMKIIQNTNAPPAPQCRKEERPGNSIFPYIIKAVDKFEGKYEYWMEQVRDRASLFNTQNEAEIIRQQTSEAEQICGQPSASGPTVNCVCPLSRTGDQNLCDESLSLRKEKEHEGGVTKAYGSREYEEGTSLEPSNPQYGGSSSDSPNNLKLCEEEVPPSGNRILMDNIMAFDECNTRYRNCKAILEKVREMVPLSNIEKGTLLEPSNLQYGSSSSASPHNMKLYEEEVPPSGKRILMNNIMAFDECNTRYRNCKAILEKVREMVPLSNIPEGTSLEPLNPQYGGSSSDSPNNLKLCEEEVPPSGKRILMNNIMAFDECNAKYRNCKAILEKAREMVPLSNIPEGTSLEPLNPQYGGSSSDSPNNLKLCEEEVPPSGKRILMNNIMAFDECNAKYRNCKAILEKAREMVPLSNIPERNSLEPANTPNDGRSKAQPHHMKLCEEEFPPSGNRILMYIIGGCKTCYTYCKDLWEMVREMIPFFNTQIRERWCYWLRSHHGHLLLTIRPGTNLSEATLQPLMKDIECQQRPVTREHNVLTFWYEDALTECQQCYVSVRESLIGPSVRKTMSELAWKGGYDHCSHMRSACAFLIHVSQDEHRLYHQFFDRQTDVFNIAQSLNEQERSALSESRSSLVSVGSATSQEVAKINTAPLNMSEGSPADLHGMWYPPVRRTLVCLSRMYRCVERPIFQGIAQEALTLCMENVQQATNQISANKSALDGEMFQIKHLLILREQIAPFQVDFTIKSMSLDFSKTKTAAIQLINKKFSLSSNNALLEFLLEGSPEVREQWLDSRKDVDRSLKASCESFIDHATRHLMGAQFMITVDKAENWTLKETLHEQPWVKAEILAELVQSATKSIKTNLTGLQTTMKLYLANRDTEFILYRPIKNNVIGCFTRLQHLIFSGGYTQEEQSLIGCPTPEQVSILLSSVSLVAPSP